MRVVVEEMNLQRLRGWALVDVDLKERVRIFGRVGDRLVVSATADQFRSDLLDNGIGDGCYGFEIQMPSDVISILIERNHALEITGTSTQGHEQSAEFPFGKPSISELISNKSREFQAAILFGESYFLDNFAGDMTKPRRLENQTKRLFYSIRTCSFGDYLWWEDNSIGGKRTAARLFAGLDDISRRLIAEGSMSIVFDMSSEGPPASYYGEWLELLHDELERQSINADSCVLVNQNRAFEYDYRQWCRSKNIAFRMHVLNYDYYVSKLALLLNEASLDCTAPLPTETMWRHYMCLNFTPRRDRIAFVSWLIGSGLARKGYVSFAGFQNKKADGREFEIPRWYPDKPAAETGMRELRLEAPLILDLAEHKDSVVPEFDIGPPQAIAGSFFTIVTESDFSPGDIIRVTEKIIKPLAYGHPLIVVGNPDSLRIVRDLGFKTFSPWIDETYDGVDDRAIRMQMVQKEVRRLCEMTFADMIALRARLEETVHFNFEHARRGLAKLYQEHINIALLDDLARARPINRALCAYFESEIL